MQKIFVKYFLYIAIVTVLMTTFINAIIQAKFAEDSARIKGKKIVREIEDRIERNNREISILTQNLNENYIARAKAFAEIIAQNPNMLYDTKEMIRMTKVLSVDEVHVTNENGILEWGSLPEYYGLDFTEGEQTRAFLPALTDKSFQLAQEPIPNSKEGKLFQYISVARQDEPGIVQVGISPIVLKEALANNEINKVISNFNVADGEDVIVFEKETGIVIADTNNTVMNQSYEELGISEDCFSLKRDSAWITLNNKMTYFVFDKCDKYIAAVSYTGKSLLMESRKQNIVAAVSNMFLGLFILIAILILLKKVIIKDMEKINGDVKAITEGNLEIVITAKSTPEFLALGEGINEMVVSLKENIKKIANQAQKLEESNKNIISSLNYARRIQNNILPSDEAFKEVFSDYSILWKPRDEVGGDIYWIKSFQKSTVLCVCDCTGHGTPGALLTMLVVTALENIVKEENCLEPNTIMWELEQILIRTLNTSDNFYDIKDGADLAIISIDKDGTIRMSSAKTRIFVCNGNDIENIKGQRLSIGEGKITDKTQIKIREIPYAEGNKYYIASDGIFDQIGGEDRIPYGYQYFMKVLLQNHKFSQERITDEIWSNFQEYMGNESRRDDIVLLSFELRGKEN